MTKTEFLEHLEKRLHVLNKKERDDILSEYAQHIELKMENGLCEEEAIQDFGNLDELEAEILDAYNVNPDYDKKSFHMDKSKIKSRMAKAGDRVESLWKKGPFRLTEGFNDKIISQLKMFLKVCLILGILLLIYLPCVNVIFWFADHLYSFFSWPLDQMFSWGIVLIFHVFYLIFALLVLYTFTHGNRQGERKEKAQGGTEAMEFAEIKPRRARLLSPVGDLLSRLRFSRTERDRSTKSFGNFVGSTWNAVKYCIALLIKGAAICFLAPIFLFLLLLVVAFGTLMVLLVLGYPVIGLSIMTLGGLLSGFAFIWFLCNILFVRKVREEN